MNTNLQDFVDDHGHDHVKHTPHSETSRMSVEGLTDDESLGRQDSGEFLRSSSSDEENNVLIPDHGHSHVEHGHPSHSEHTGCCHGHAHTHGDHTHDHSHASEVASIPGHTTEKFVLQSVKGKTYLIPAGALIVDVDVLTAQYEKDSSTQFIVADKTVCNWEYFIPMGTPIPNTEANEKVIAYLTKPLSGREIIVERNLKDALTSYKNADSLPELKLPKGTFIPSVPSAKQKMPTIMPPSSTNSSTGKGHVHGPSCDCAPNMYGPSNNSSSSPSAEHVVDNGSTVKALVASRNKLFNRSDSGNVNERASNSSTPSAQVANNGLKILVLI